MKNKRIIAAAMATGMAVSLAACGGSASTTDTTGTADAATTEAADAATGEGTGFTVQLGPNPETLDPALNAAVDGGNTLITIEEPLLIIDENNEIQPGQAESYEVSDDGLVWTFHLRDGLKWSDGSDLTAKDFEYSFKRLACPDTAAPYAETVVGMIDGYQDAIGNPDADGNTTTDPDWDALNVVASEDGKDLTITLSYPCSYFDKLAAFVATSPVQQATVDANGSVTAKAPGRTKITVTSAENSSYQASCTVTVPYNITYKLNKGKNNASNPSTYYGKKITLKNPSRKGYTFAGWYTDAKFKKKIKTIESSAKCDYTLYAKWTKVNVAKVSITSAKNSKSKQILLKYKKISGIKGYEISYSTDKKFKKAVTRKNTTKTSYTISKLKKGKTYYVRIRAYKVDSTGKKVYGKYTSVKKVKVSK